jgi:hypothetical protein
MGFPLQSPLAHAASVMHSCERTGLSSPIYHQLTTKWLITPPYLLSLHSMHNWQRNFNIESSIPTSLLDSIDTSDV